METIPPSFADLLKQYRAAAGLTQEELGQRANLSTRTVSDLERGISHRPYGHTVQRLAEALALNPDEVERFRWTSRNVNVERVEDSRHGEVTRQGLPIQPTPFIGRTHDVQKVRNFLGRDDVRLLTLAGPGGVGKTRLALRAVEEMGALFPDGVVPIFLASLTEPDLVLSTVANALNVFERNGESTLQGIVQHVAEKRLLLFMDNFEHVLPAAQQFCHVLSACSQVKILVTSREVLHLAAEHVYAVPCLAVPTAEQGLQPDALQGYDAIQLFMQRAQSAAPGFKMTYETAGTIAEICRRLDGLPLAIELAAARIAVLSPDGLLTRLGDRLKLLRRGPRDAPARQQTLYATLSWSYDLLDAEERDLFARLGVFAGGFTIEAAEAVSDAELDTLESLLGKNLVAREGERLRMLETIREFAAGKFEELSEAEEVRRRYALYFLAIARSANLIQETEGEQRHNLIIQDRDNVRRALEWALESGEIDLGLELAAVLENYWASNSPLEGIRWLDESLRRASTVSSDLHALALRARGSSTYNLGEFEKGTWYYVLSLGEYRRLGDERGIAIMHHRLAIEVLRRGDAEGAAALAQESIRVHREIKFAKGEAQVLGLLADLELGQGHGEAAFELLERSVVLCEESGFVWWRARMLCSLAALLLEWGRVPEADARVRQALPLFARMGDRQGAIYALALLLRVATETGQLHRAGRLWGVIEAEEARGRIGQWEAERDQYAQQALRCAGPEFERGREEGARLTLKEALDEALDALREPIRVHS